MRKTSLPRRLMKTLILLLVLVSTQVKAAAPRILFMVNEGFNAHEYYVPLKIFKDQGFEIRTAAKENALVSPDYRQRKDFPSVRPDFIFTDINADDYDAIVFAGGNGSWEDYFPNDDVHKVLTQFMKAGKLTALLCSSTGLLGIANNLDGKGQPLGKGKNVTGYFRVEGLIKVMGKANYYPGEKNQPFVMVDGNLITGRDPLSAELFGKTVVEELLKK